jgi:hypothetical protein
LTNIEASLGHATFGQWLVECSARRGHRPEPDS